MGGSISHPDGHNREKDSRHIETHLAFTSLPPTHHTLEPTLETHLLTPWGPEGVGWGADPRGPSDLLPFPEHTVNCPAWQRLLPHPVFPLHLAHCQRHLSSPAQMSPLREVVPTH